jgi:hypothetical protein
MVFYQMIIENAIRGKGSTRVIVGDGFNEEGVGSF